MDTVDYEKLVQILTEKVLERIQRSKEETIGNTTAEHPYTIGISTESITAYKSIHIDGIELVQAQSGEEYDLLVVEYLDIHQIMNLSSLVSQDTKTKCIVEAMLKNKHIIVLSDNVHSLLMDKTLKYNIRSVILSNMKKCEVFGIEFKNLTTEESKLDFLKQYLIKNYTVSTNRTSQQGAIGAIKGRTKWITLSQLQKMDPKELAQLTNYKMTPLAKDFYERHMR